METSFNGFNQPFLLQPELWYSLIPRISYRDMVNLFVTAKFVDLSQAQVNFSIAREIWCKQVSLVTLVDTLHHASKKTDDAFFTIIKIRNEFPSNPDRIDTEVLQIELLELIDSVEPDYLEKIIRIALKAGYLDVLESCLDRLIVLEIDHLPDLLSYATICEKGSNAIPLLLRKIKDKLLPGQFELVVKNWFSLPMNNEEFHLEEKEITFFGKAAHAILQAANWDLYSQGSFNDFVTEEKKISHEELDRKLRIIISGLNTIRDFSNYNDIWWNILWHQLKLKQNDCALQILQKTPCPVLLELKLLNQLLRIAMDNEHTEFIRKFIVQLDLEFIIENTEEKGNLKKLSIEFLFFILKEFIPSKSDETGSE